MKKSHRFLLFIILLPVICSGCFFTKNEKFVIINDKKITVEVAQSEAEKTKGLSGKTILAENQGLLFVYDDYQIRNFWMKDMLFSIDIIWIKDGIIAGIEKNLPPPSGENLKIYRSSVPINYVLEVAAGFCDKNNIKTGDYLKFNL